MRSEKMTNLNFVLEMGSLYRQGLSGQITSSAILTFDTPALGLLLMQVTLT